MDETETLYSVIVVPPDMEEGQLVHHALTQAEVQGLSVLRGHATNEEFIEVAKRRIANRNARGDASSVVGVAQISCSDVRQLRADANSPGRTAGVRLFCLYDTDEPALPAHADIFQTFPRGLSKTKAAASRKYDRTRLLQIISAKIIPAEAFRGGILSRL